MRLKKEISEAEEQYQSKKASLAEFEKKYIVAKRNFECGGILNKVMFLSKQKRDLNNLEAEYKSLKSEVESLKGEVQGVSGSLKLHQVVKKEL